MHGLERDLDERARVVRLNLAEEPGQRARERFATEKVPALILLDGAGREVYRTEGKLPRRQELFEALDSLQA